MVSILTKGEFSMTDQPIDPDILIAGCRIQGVTLLHELVAAGELRALDMFGGAKAAKAAITSQLQHLLAWSA